MKRKQPSRPLLPQTKPAAVEPTPEAKAEEPFLRFSQSGLLTDQQYEANLLLAGEQRWTCLVGGSRSGKTFAICRRIVLRAILAPGSLHLIARWRAVDAWTSIALETLPKVFQICFPGTPYTINGSLRFFELKNGAQIWIGGLADKDQADKVLGHEYATTFINECSQISYASASLVRSRLAQVCLMDNGEVLTQKGFYDLNPTGKGHWTNVEFGGHRSPVDNKPIKDAYNFKRMFLNPEGHKRFLTAEYIESLRNMPERQKARFYDGRYVDEVSNALWSFDLLETGRVAEYPDLTRIVVAVDPSGAKNELDTTHDMIGIVVVGRAANGHAYVLDDRTMLGSPKSWARTAVAAYHYWRADAIVAETNFGGAMVANTIEVEDSTIKVVEVHASRGKAVRAEPVSALYGDPADPFSIVKKPRAHHVGTFVDLENELTQFTDMGYMGERSPNRADALVWAMTELMLGESVDGWMNYYKDITANTRGEPNQEQMQLKHRTLGTMKGIPHMKYAPATGVTYTADQQGYIHDVDPDHRTNLLKGGCTEVVVV